MKIVRGQVVIGDVVKVMLPNETVVQAEPARSMEEFSSRYMKAIGIEITGDVSLQIINRGHLDAHEIIWRDR